MRRGCERGGRDVQCGSSAMGAERSQKGLSAAGRVKGRTPDL